MSKIGVMVCGHGSRDDEAIAEFARGGRRHRRSGCRNIRSTAASSNSPGRSSATASTSCAAQGVERILAVPGMLFAAGHVKNDIPSVLNDYAAPSIRELRIDYGRDLAIDPQLLRAAGERIEQAERVVEPAGAARGDAADGRRPRHLRPRRQLQHQPRSRACCGKAWASAGPRSCYSGVTFPLVGPALEHAVKLGYRRIVVFPYFLFTGVLVKRIYRIADEMAARHPEIEFLKAPYLNDHPLVLDAFADRVRGDPRRREQHELPALQIPRAGLGFEAEVGLPQAGHHHHVQGIGTTRRSRHATATSIITIMRSSRHDHDHDHDHGHITTHGHAPCRAHRTRIIAMAPAARNPERSSQRRRSACTPIRADR